MDVAPDPQGSPESSRIAAFLPARQLWAWQGKGFKRNATKSARNKKLFFKSIQRGKETISVSRQTFICDRGVSNHIRFESHTGWGQRCIPIDRSSRSPVHRPNRIVVGNNCQQQSGQSEVVLSSRGDGRLP